MGWKETLMKKVAIILALICGCCWACITIFVRVLNVYGLETMDKVLIRCTLSSVILFLIMLFKDRGMLKIRLRDLWIFIVSAVVTVVLFNFCYFQSINTLSISILSAILYISPAFVMIASAIIFKEKITRYKIIALILLGGGLLLVTGIIGSDLMITGIGFLYCIGSALCYAAISILTTLSVRRGYSGFTHTFYTYFFALLIVIFIADRKRVFSAMFSEPKAFFLMTAFALVSTVIPFVLYAVSLKHLDPSQAAIICSVEIVVAALISTIIYKEPMTVLMVVGIVLIMLGIVFGNLQKKTGSKDAGGA